MKKTVADSHGSVDQVASVGLSTIFTYQDASVPRTAQPFVLTEIRESLTFVTVQKTERLTTGLTKGVVEVI